MAGAAAVVDEDRLPGRRCRRRRPPPGRRPGPLVEVGLRHHDHGRAHHRMPEAAELGADDRVGAELVRRHGHLRGRPGHGVLLLPEFRNPERVDHVERPEREARRPVDRQPEDVRGQALLLRVLERPGELLRGDVDAQRVRAGAVVSREDDRRDDRHRGHERERDRRPRDLEPRVPVDRRARPRRRRARPGTSTPSTRAPR